MMWGSMQPKGSVSGDLFANDESRQDTAQDDGTEDMIGVDLLYQMDVEDITALRKYFFPKSMGTDWLKENPEGLSLNKTEFINAMDSIAGSCVLSLCAAKLFDALDIDDSGLLQWEEVLDAIIEKTNISRRVVEGDCLLINSKRIMTSIPHCRGEPIIKIVPLETETTFCYAIVSKYGRVGVYDGDFKLLDSYRLGLKPDEEAVRDFSEYDAGEGQRRQRRQSVSTYLTDAIFIPDTYALLLASSDRSLHLYDATGLVHVPLWHIIGVPNVTTCMAYHASVAGNTPGLLLLGDDRGDITIMRFHQARNTLLKKKHPDKLDVFYWMELPAQSDYVTHKTLSKVHDSAVIQVAFSPDNETILSCSRDAASTLVIRHILDKRRPYLFKLPCGIRCFHEDRLLHVLVTGSNDKIVRIWNPVVTQQPLVALRGHQSGVVDVRIIRFLASIFSFDANAVLKIWDIREEYCLMTLHLDFPAFKMPGKKIFFGGRSLYPGALRGSQEIPLDSRSTRSSNIQFPNKTSVSGSNDAQTDPSANALLCEDTEWQRDSLIAACCDCVATIHINPNFFMPVMMRNAEETPQMPDILPPPTKEHYASAPSPWRVGDPSQAPRTPRGSIGSKSTKSTSSTTSSSLPLKGKEAVAAAAPVKDIHARRTQHRIKQQQMQMLVEQGAPHLALDLHPLQPIKFSRPLPITAQMRDKGIDVSDPERFLRSRIMKESSRNVGGYPSQNSSAKSSKSSVPSKRRTTATSKGRNTPEWFADAVDTCSEAIRTASKTGN